MTVFDEIFEYFDEDLKAIAVAIHSKDNTHTSNRIYKNIIESRWQPYELPLRKLTELWQHEINAYKELAKIDYNQCRETLEASAEYLRLKDFTIEPETARLELKNLESIIEHSKALHSLISKLRGATSHYDKPEQRTLF